MEEAARAEIEREIVTRVAEAVARFGVAGDVRLDADHVVLEGYGPTVTAHLGTLPDDWVALAPDVRVRRCTDVARRLVGERRASTPAPPKRDRLFPTWLPPIAIGLAAIAAVTAAWHALSPPEQMGRSARPAPVVLPASSAERADQTRQERAERVCNEARARALRGGTLGPTDVEGWVVEIGLLRPGNTPALVFDPGLSSFVDRPAGKLVGRFAWPGAPSIGSQSGPGTEVEIDDASVPDATHPAWRGVTLTFTGRYATPYFHDDQRQDFVRVAATLADRLGATYAGLYAHCAADSTHHAGSWFEGPGPGGATTAMLYFMGLYADAPQRLGALLGPDGGAPGRARALQRIAEATKDLRRERVATLLGTYGGMIAGRADGPSYVTFPFRDSNRAARASYGLAGALALITMP